MAILAASSQKTPPVQTIGLLDLPAELRLQIYRQCVRRGGHVDATHWRRPQFREEDEGEEAGHWEDDTQFAGAEGPAKDGQTEASNLTGLSDIGRSNNSLFVVSKQISEETLDILYGENTFEVELHNEPAFPKNVSERNRRRMRHVIVIAMPPGFRVSPGWRPDHALWSSTLPSLKSLRLVALEPGAHLSFYPYEELMDMWLMWINPFLICFGQYVQRSTLLEVEVNEGAETIELVKVHFPHGHRQLQCHVENDYIIARGRFSTAEQNTMREKSELESLRLPIRNEFSFRGFDTEVLPSREPHG